MGFILDKSMGQGPATVKIKTDGINKSEDSKTGQLKIQVNGLTKAIIQLVQKGAVYKTFITSSVTNVDPEGGKVKITYWTEMNNKVVDDKPTLTGTTNITASGKDADGKYWVEETIPANNTEVDKTFSYEATNHGKTANVSVSQEFIKIYEVYLEVDDNHIGSDGGIVNLTTWVTMNGKIIPDEPTVTGINNQVSKSHDTGKWIIQDSIQINNDLENEKVFTYKASSHNKESQQVVTQEKGKPMSLEVIVMIDQFGVGAYGSTSIEDLKAKQADTNSVWDEREYPEHLYSDLGSTNKGIRYYNGYFRVPLHGFLIAYHTPVIVQPGYKTLPVANMEGYIHCRVIEGGSVLDVDPSELTLTTDNSSVANLSSEAFYKDGDYMRKAVTFKSNLARTSDGNLLAGGERYPRLCRLTVNYRGKRNLSETLVFEQNGYTGGWD